jgi:hypothetical protein
VSTSLPGRHASPARPARRRYSVTVPHGRGGHAPPETVVVHLTAEVGPGGDPVYCDATGEFRVQIADGAAWPLTSDEGCGCRRCYQAVPLG